MNRVDNATCNTNEGAVTAMGTTSEYSTSVSPTVSNEKLAVLYAKYFGDECYESKIGARKDSICDGNADDNKVND